MANYYTLGRGKVHFARFKPGTNIPDGFRYIGNTPEFNLTIESQTLDHYSSDEGIREKDDSVPLEVNRTGALTTDNIDPQNVALFFFGESSVITQAVVASTAETITGITLGRSYKLGSTTLNPAGAFGINTVGLTVEKVGTPNVALVEGTDYSIDLNLGVVTILETATLIAAGGVLEVNYAVRGSTRERVISGSEPVEGAMMYITKNPKGPDSIYYLPYTKITPNGDYALKGDEWQTIPLSLEILKLPDSEAIYRDGVPAYA